MSLGLYDSHHEGSLEGFERKDNRPLVGPDANQSIECSNPCSGVDSENFI